MAAWKFPLTSLMFAAIFCLTGCEPKKGGSPPMKPEHHDAEEGPHGGAIAEWEGHGVHLHAEFTVKHEAEEATVYILGEDEKTAKPIAVTEISVTLKDPAVTIKLAAAPEKDDPKGMASRFVGKEKALKDPKDYEGTIGAMIDGKKFEGSFKEKSSHHH